MSERDQQHVRPSHRETEDITETAVPRNQDLEESVDSILEEIDSVLEENAEDFVKSFVQKGGQ